MNVTVNSPNGPLPAMDIGLPGLVIARTRSTHGDQIWSVTHVPSQACVCWFNDPESACKAAVELACLCDWTADAETIKAAGIGPQVAAVMKANRGSNLTVHGSI